EHRHHPRGQPQRPTPPKATARGHTDRDRQGVPHPARAPARTRRDLRFAAARVRTSLGLRDSTRKLVTFWLANARAERPEGAFTASKVPCGRREALPESALSEAVALMIDLAQNGFYRTDYRSMLDRAQPAVEAAKRVGDPPLTAAAEAMLALADAMTGS